jgi:hypothetical protein
LLTDEAGFTDEDVSSLRRRRMIVKILPSEVKSEIAVFGAVRLEDLPEVSLESVRDGFSQSMLDVKAGGQLNTLPSLGDLTSLTFEDRDIEDLKTCVVGKCSVQLPAPVIGTINANVDWNAPDYNLRANTILKQFLIDYAKDYLARGDEAVVAYADHRKRSAGHSPEYSSMIQSVRLIRVAAPEFENYILSFPNADIPGIVNTLEWTKVATRLKPVISLAHVASYPNRSDGNATVFIVAKQLYANHYLDASLTASAIVQFDVGETAETYLVLENRTRSDALSGAFGNWIRGLAEKEAEKRVTEILGTAGNRIEARTQRQSDMPRVEEEKAVLFAIPVFLTDPIFLIPFGLTVAFTLLLVIRGRRRDAGPWPLRRRRPK